MTFFPNSKIFIQIGPVSIAWYAVLIMTGVIICSAFAWRQLKKNGYQFDLVEDLFVGCLLSGFAGARLWYCLFYNAEYYFSNPIQILMVHEGGLAIQGGLFAGAAYALYYVRKRKIDFMRAADAVVPCMLIAQALGRWGNFANQEAFGKIVDASYYAGWPAFISNQMFINGAFREPTFLYESVGNIVGFILIWFVYRTSKFRKRGDLAYAYLVWYGVVRFFVEGLRTDSLMLGPIRMAQLTSVFFIIVGVVGILGVFRKFTKKQKPVLLFDLDGTLLDTEPAIIATFQKLFDKYKPTEEFTKEMQLAVIGPSLKESFAWYFPEQDFDSLLAEFRKLNNELHHTHVKLMPNAKELLKSLKEEGYSIGIVSSKKSDGVKFGIDLFEISQYIDVMLGYDNVEKMKPDPEGIKKACHLLNRGFDDCIYIGDSDTDIQAAHAAGVFSIGYEFNPARKDVLYATKPNRIINDLSEVKEILKEDHSWTYNLM